MMGGVFVLYGDEGYMFRKDSNVAEKMMLRSRRS